MRPINRYLSTKIKTSDIKATDDTIKKIVKDELDRLGHNADLNHIDVSEVTFMFSLFSCAPLYLGPKYKDLNPDISQWNVSNVIDMRWMFYECKNFNQDLSQWDVSNVKDMYTMFYECNNFNQDISGWNVSNVENMDLMFCGCRNFNQDLSQWKVNKVVNHISMFDDCPIKEEFKPKFKK